MIGHLAHAQLRQLQLSGGCSLALLVPLPLSARGATRGREAAWEVLRSVLAHLVSQPAHSLRFAKNDHGKPCMEGPGSIGFNVSHSRAHSLIALSASGEVGCDIEDRFTDEDVAPLCSLILHPTELRAVQQLPPGEGTQAFRRYWVRKEAALKAMGTGFLQDPREIVVGLAEGARVGAPAGGIPPFHLHEQCVDSGCAAAVASMDPACRWLVLEAGEA